MSAIASAVACTPKFANDSLGVSTCSTSRQHRLTSIQIFCRILFLDPLPVSPKTQSFNRLVVVITSRKFHRNPFSNFAKQKKYR